MTRHWKFSTWNWKDIKEIIKNEIHRDIILKTE
jgi:hypothetical protein